VASVEIDQGGRGHRATKFRLEWLPEAGGEWETVKVYEANVSSTGGPPVLLMPIR
jgi:hypothetical protein